MNVGEGDKRKSSVSSSDVEGQKDQQVPLNDIKSNDEAGQVYGSPEDKFLQDESRPIVKNAEPPNSVEQTTEDVNNQVPSTSTDAQKTI